MTLDNMTGITEGSYTGFCKSQLITCNFVKACNGVCPFEDALKHADKMQAMDEQHIVDHDRDWIIGCIQHDGFIHTHRFDKANQIILEALSTDRPTGEWIITKEGEYDGRSVHKTVCSECGHETFYKANRAHFCPNCGADMRGKEECKLPNNCGEWRPIDKPKAGRWVTKEKTDEHGCYWWRECSECGRKPLLNRWNHGEDLSDYCPNCGAKMTKGGDTE